MRNGSFCWAILTGLGGHWHNIGDFDRNELRHNRLEVEVMYETVPKVLQDRREKRTHHAYKLIQVIPNPSCRIILHHIPWPYTRIRSATVTPKGIRLPYFKHHAMWYIIKIISQNLWSPSSPRASKQLTPPPILPCRNHPLPDYRFSPHSRPDPSNSSNSHCASF